MLLDIVHLSLSKVLRNSRRTILTLLSIATGFVALVSFGTAHLCDLARLHRKEKTIADENLIEAVNLQGNRLRNGLQKIADKNPFIGDARGRGLFLGIELVADKVTKSQFPKGQPLRQP